MVYYMRMYILRLCSIYVQCCMVENSSGGGGGAEVPSNMGASTEVKGF